MLPVLQQRMRIIDLTLRLEAEPDLKEDALEGKYPFALHIKRLNALRGAK